MHYINTTNHALVQFSDIHQPIS